MHGHTCTEGNRYRYAYRASEQLAGFGGRPPSELALSELDEDETDDPDADTRRYISAEQLKHPHKTAI